MTDVVIAIKQFRHRIPSAVARYLIVYRPATGTELIGNLISTRRQQTPRHEPEKSVERRLTDAAQKTALLQRCSFCPN
jgi:hypothetical protein